MRDLDPGWCAMMSKLLIVIAFSATLFLVLNTLPADAAVKGSLTSAGGSECDLRETGKSGSDVRRLRLNCECKDAESNVVKYQCYYISDTSTCCKKSSETSVNHYHDYEPAYYGQVADQIKGKNIDSTCILSHFRS